MASPSVRRSEAPHLLLPSQMVGQNAAVHDARCWRPSGNGRARPSMHEFWSLPSLDGGCVDRAANARELLRPETPSRLQEVSSSNKQLQTRRKGGTGCWLSEINREVSQSAVQPSTEETVRRPAWQGHFP